MSTPTTVRLDTVHERMLLALQAHRPGVSRQKVFEELIENAYARESVDVEGMLAEIVAEDAEALRRLADL